jgi:hypothetical protein
MSQMTCSKGEKVKGKVHSRKRHEGLEVKWYSYTLSLTSALDEGSRPRPGRFTPGKDLVHIV